MSTVPSPGLSHINPVRAFVVVVLIASVLMLTFWSALGLSAPVSPAATERYRFETVCPTIQSDDLGAIIAKLEVTPVLSAKDRATLEVFRKVCDTLNGWK
jgi:hypothetical protein